MNWFSWQEAQRAFYGGWYVQRSYLCGEEVLEGGVEEMACDAKTGKGERRTRILPLALCWSAP